MDTFKGALNYSIRTFLHSFPIARIFLITPWWMPTLDERNSDTNPNGIGLFLKDYVSAMVELAELNHIPCLDLFSTSGVSSNNYKDFTLDGIHPNDAGVYRRGEMISHFVKSL